MITGEVLEVPIKKSDKFRLQIVFEAKSLEKSGEVPQLLHRRVPNNRIVSSDR